MVDWALARQIARFAAGSSAGAPPLDADFPTLVRESEAHLRDYTGLELSAPVPAPEPVGRAEWAEVNLESLALLLEPVSERQVLLVTILRDRHAFHELHDEIRSAALGRSGVENGRDIRMVHHRHGLPFRLEAGDDLA